MDAASRRAKLGLALAGGGLRAALFHLGVLRRMAELDLLRYVEVLSTVSGGSIIGALYILLLRHRLEAAPSGRLSREEYLALVQDLERILVRGASKNLRVRLFLNPFTVLRVMLTPWTLGQAMGRLYERYLFRAVTELPDFRRGGPGRKVVRRPGAVPLRDLLVRPGGRPVEGGIEAHNRSVTAAGGSAVTNHIINATALNSGSRFWFSSVEAGDTYLGCVRHSELGELLDRKALLRQEASRQRPAPGTRGSLPGRGEAPGPGAVALARWWLGDRRHPPTGWEELFELEGFPGRLTAPDASLGPLRRAKLAAWYLARGPRMTPPVTGGVPPGEHWFRFWAGLRDLDEELAERVRAEAEARGERWAARLLEFVIEVYLLRSAELVSPAIERFWAEVTLGDAVAASACFPPVFAPIAVPRFYDEWYVSRLGLTDGGVYDNLGLTALLDEECNYIVASDTSGLLGVAERAAAGRLGMSARIMGILMEAVAEGQRAALRERRRVSRAISTRGESAAWADFHAGRDLRALAYFHMTSPRVGAEGLELGLEPADLARIRTDLDGFGEVEIAALVNHGYDMADRYLRQYFAGTPYHRPELWKPPDAAPMALEVDLRVRRILRVGRARFFRALRLSNPISWALTLGGVAWAMWAARSLTVSPKGLVVGLAERSVEAAERWVPFIGAGWAAVAMPAWEMIAAAAVIVVLVVTWRHLLERLTRRGTLEWARRVALLGRAARGYAGNLLWPFGAAPVGLALLVSAAAWVSYLGFHLPFRWSARVRRRREPG